MTHNEPSAYWMVPHLMCPCSASNIGACSTNSWIACVKYSMNTQKGVFSLLIKGPCFFSQPESSRKWVGSPQISTSTSTGPRLWLFFIFFWYPQFHVPQPRAVSVRMTDFTTIFTLPFRAVNALSLLICAT